MKILIAGSGDTGTHLAKMLSHEDQDVVLISDDRSRLESLDTSYNIMVSPGSVLSLADLRAAGADEAELFIAVTPDETVNLISCEMARRLGAARCVARVCNPDFMHHDIADTFRHAGVDSLILPEMLACREICNLIRRSWAVNWFELNRGRLVLAGMRITEHSPACGKALRDIHVDGQRVHVAAIRSGNELIIPRGDNVLRVGDLAYVTFSPDDEEYVRRIAAPQREKTSNIMIIGGGLITEFLCRELSGRYHVTVVEPNRKRCRQLAERHPSITAVNTDSHDFSTLRDEGLQSTDLFIALNAGDEQNIVDCMVARRNGVHTTVAEIEDLRYLADAEQLRIDKIVNKKLLTSAHVLRDILGKDVRVSELMALEDAEIAEIEAGENSKVTQSPVKDLHLPKELTLGGLIRNGEGHLISGDTQILPGDLVLVVFRPGNLLKVKRLFR